MRRLRTHPKTSALPASSRQSQKGVREALLVFAAVRDQGEGDVGQHRHLQQPDKGVADRLEPGTIFAKKGPQTMPRISLYRMRAVKLGRQGFAG
jgi:hypothetical protein